MVDYSNPILLRLRAVGQSLHILRPVVRAYRRLTNRSYEEAYHSSAMSKIEYGDIVWDVGANEGYYTDLFADAVGPTGMVVAFEPSPETAARLRTRFTGRSNVLVVETALSDKDGEELFYTSHANTTDGMAKSEGSSSVVVKVSRGDSLKNIPSPTILKVDVEGFEWEVLRGLKDQVASNHSLRHVFVEVHFLVLARRGMANAPRDISGFLSSCGFRVTWPDASHIVATRNE